MGIIRLTLITAFLLWLGLKYFGRDEGLSDALIGRAPEPAPVVAVREEEPETAPAEEPPVAEDAVETLPPDEAPDLLSPEALDAAVADALTDTPADTPESVPEAVATPEPAAIAEPEPAVATADPEPAPQPEAAPLLYVTGSMVNVRAGPATVYDVITALPHGAPVTDLGDAGEGWRIIQLDSGEIGYMSGDFLSPEAP